MTKKNRKDDFGKTLKEPELVEGDDSIEAFLSGKRRGKPIKVAIVMPSTDEELEDLYKDLMEILRGGKS